MKIRGIKKIVLSAVMAAISVTTCFSNISFANAKEQFKILTPTELSTKSYSSSLSVTWTRLTGATEYKISVKDITSNSLVCSNLSLGNRKSYVIPAKKLEQSHKYHIAVGAFDSKSSATGKWTEVEPIYISSSTYSKISPYVSQKGINYGQFAYKDNSDASITIDPIWKNDWITQMPVTGISKINSITIHKNAVNMFKAAFENIKTKSVKVDANGTMKPLSELISTYDGTWVARHKDWNKSKALSNHSWGISIDINASTHGGKINYKRTPYDYNYLLWENAFKPAGFLWGNSYSDSMHFEIVKR